MNYLQISLTSKCNRKCWHCPMADYRNTDDPKYHLTNDVLIPWLEKNIDPQHWLIELTGGEPTLYDGISELLDWLSEHRYLVHIRTNGIIPVMPRPGLKRIVAFHDLANPPEVFDVVLIVDKIEKELKVAYCEERHYPYKVIGFNSENPDRARHNFDQCAYIEPTCHQTGCRSNSIPVIIVDGPDGKKVDIGRMDYAPFKTAKCCRHCKAAIDAWRFYEEK